MNKRQKRAKKNRNSGIEIEEEKAKDLTKEPKAPKKKTTVRKGIIMVMTCYEVF